MNRHVSSMLLLAEFSIGKQFKRGVIGSFAGLAGKKYAWGGFFITVCTLGIGFYYSVVTGWALRYLGLSLEQLWASISGGETLGQQLSNNPEPATDNFLPHLMTKHQQCLQHVATKVMAKIPRFCCILPFVRDPWLNAV